MYCSNATCTAIVLFHVIGVTIGTDPPQYFCWSLPKSFVKVRTCLHMTTTPLGTSQSVTTPNSECALHVRDYDCTASAHSQHTVYKKRSSSQPFIHTPVCLIKEFLEHTDGIRCVTDRKDRQYSCPCAETILMTVHTVRASSATCTGADRGCIFENFLRAKRIVRNDAVIVSGLSLACSF